MNASNLIITLTSDRDPAISNAAFKFGIVLLEGGNQDVQKTLLHNLTRTRHDNFFSATSNMIVAAAQVVQDRALISQAVEDAMRADGQLNKEGPT